MGLGRCTVSALKSGWALPLPIADQPSPCCQPWPQPVSRVNQRCQWWKENPVYFFSSGDLALITLPLHEASIRDPQAGALTLCRSPSPRPLPLGLPGACAHRHTWDELWLQPCCVLPGLPGRYHFGRNGRLVQEAAWSRMDGMSSLTMGVSEITLTFLLCSEQVLSPGAAWPLPAAPSYSSKEGTHSPPAPTLHFVAKTFPQPSCCQWGNWAQKGQTSHLLGRWNLDPNQRAVAPGPQGPGHRSASACSVAWVQC